MKTHWASLVRSCTLALIIAVLGSTTPLSAYTYLHFGVNSNFLIHGGRVHFVQADGTLTVLDLETGEVIARGRNGGYDGTLHLGETLRLTESGILVMTYREVALLNTTTLDVIWRTTDTGDPHITGRHLVSRDGNGLVACRELATGRVLWSYDLPGVLHITVEGGKVLAFRSSVYDGPSGVPAVVLLDIETGRELLYKTAPSGVHYIDAFFDGERIYLPTGTYTGAHTPDVTRYDQGRPSARFERLLVWDLNGNEVESVPVPKDFEGKRPPHEEPLALAGKVFARGRVWDSVDAIPPPPYEVVRERMTGDSGTGVVTPRFSLVDGTLTARRGGFDAEADGSISVSLESGGSRWTGTLPYLKGPGEISAVGSTGERILLGSNLGHVECIDLRSGKSLWMYVFPTVRQTRSYSSRGMPPYMATAAAAYERDNRNPKPESGFVVDGSDGPSEPKIILDPSPSNPFEKLPVYLTMAWSGALVPPVLIALVVFAGRKSRWDRRTLAGLALVLTVPAIVCLWFYGRVSFGSSVGLRAGILVPLLAAFVYSAMCLWEKRWISGALLLLSSAVIAVFLLPLFMHL